MEDKCQSCKKKPAEVRCIIIIDGERIVKHLCAECARNAGFDEQLRLRRRHAQKFFVSPLSKKDLICPECKLGFSQFVETGYLGCAKCYKAFDQRLGNILKGIHSASYHRGRGPGDEQTADIAQLKWKLFEAVDAENFEKAAELRDEIVRIEKDTN